MTNQILSDKMPAETTNGMIDWLKSVGESLLVFTAPISVLIWKCFEYLNKRTEAQTRRDREFVKDVAKEVSREVVKEIMDSTLPDIQRNIQEIKKDTHQSFKEINDRIDDVILNIKK